MADLRSTTIAPISIYCFLLGVFALSLAANTILCDTNILSSNNFLLWIPLVSFCIIASCLFLLGYGILKMNNLCWKIFFFFLVICVSSVASLILVFIVLFFINSNIIYTFLQSSKINTLEWFAFLFFFLSEIIVLYYLSTAEVVDAFGGMGELISPF